MLFAQNVGSDCRELDSRFRRQLHVLRQRKVLHEKDTHLR